jgi:hypothetical protein
MADIPRGAGSTKETPSGGRGGNNQGSAGRRAGGSEKSKSPGKGGANAREAQEWGGGSKGSKGGVTRGDRKNPQSSARS